MQKYGLVSTCHVVTGLLDNTWSIPKKWKTCKGAISIEQLHHMKHLGHEISSHGDKHVSEINDFEISINKLVSMNLAHKKLGFSIPNSDVSSSHFNNFIKHLKANNQSYVRGGGSYKNSIFSLFVNISYKVYRILNLLGYDSLLFYNKFNKYNIIYKNNCIQRYMLPSIVVIMPEKAKTIIKFIEKMPNKNTWLIIMLHSILNVDEPHYAKDNWCWSTKNFDTLCAYLYEQQINGLLTVNTIASQLEEINNV